jgi:hypothetical protein
VLGIYIEVLQETGIVVTHQQISWLFDMLLDSNNREYREFIIEHVYEQAKRLFTPDDLEKLKTNVMETAKQL